MKALCVSKIDEEAKINFSVGEISKPALSAGQILVRVHASGVTPTELTWMPTWSTKQGAARQTPIVPGHEFCGEICEIAPDTDDVEIGQIVFGMNDWFENGAQAEFCTAAAKDVAPKPESVDHVAASVTPISALTSLQGLFDRGRLAFGETVLVHGGTGAVGSFAVQLAKLHGAHVITTASSHNLAFAKELGADEVIDYREQKFEELVKNVDLVFDTVGGETLEKSWGVLKHGGRLVTIAAGNEHTSDPRAKDAFFIVETRRDQLIEIAELIDSGKIKVVLGTAFPLPQAEMAYEAKALRGKNSIELISA